VREASEDYTKEGPAYAALSRAKDICERHLPISWKLRNSKSYKRAAVGMRFVQALDDACMLGYAWAYAEVAQHMRPLASSALASRAGAARAGRASGASRRSKTATTWQAGVKTEALKLRAKQPGISQNNLAEEIRYLLGDFSLPSIPRIIRFLSDLEHNGELPKRRK
jgi:hypothetical protein